MARAQAAELLIRRASRPLTVEEIAKSLNISWITAKSVALGLAAKNRVQAIRTANGWLFQARGHRETEGG